MENVLGSRNEGHTTKLTDIKPETGLGGPHLTLQRQKIDKARLGKYHPARNYKMQTTQNAQ